MKKDMGTVKRKVDESLTKFAKQLEGFKSELKAADSKVEGIKTELIETTIKDKLVEHNSAHEAAIKQVDGKLQSVQDRH